MSKITISRDEDNYWVTISQQGSLGILLHDSDLFGVIRAIRNEEYQNVCYNGRFGVSKDKKSVILYDLHRGKNRTCLTLSLDQASRFAKALESSFSEVINSYSYNYG